MTSDTLNRSRRRFLEFLGKSGIASHAVKGSSLLAGLLANRYANAAGAAPRVVFVYMPFGAPDNTWLPAGDTLALNEASQAYEGLQSICHFHETYVVNGGVGLIRKSLGELRWESGWTANTIDQQIAAVLGIASPLPSLHLGVQTLSAFGIEHESISRRFGRSVVSMDSPQAAYDRLFNHASSGEGEGFDALRDKHHVLDGHLQALACARNQLGRQELQTLEAYGEALRGIQSRLQGVERHPQACQQPAWNSSGFDTRGPDADDRSGGDRGAFAEQAYLQGEIIAHAFACGLTKVATLQFGDSGGSFYCHDTQFRGTYHEGFHTRREDAIEVVNYTGRCVASLIRHLTEMDDPAAPGTKLIDNTVLVQVTDDGDGTNHTQSHGPNLIATRMPAFRTGVAIAQGQTWSHDTNLGVLQAVAVGLGLEAYIGKASHHCIWPCAADAGGIYEALLA